MTTPHGESDLAWDLMELARPQLGQDEVHHIAIWLAGHEYLDAMAVAISAVERAGVPIPSELIDRLSAWSERYVGYHDYAGAPSHGARDSVELGR